MMLTPGNAVRTAATIAGRKLSKTDSSIPACGACPSSAVRHWSMTVAIASIGSTSSL